jgi:hypothetical protein
MGGDAPDPAVAASRLAGGRPPVPGAALGLVTERFKTLKRISQRQPRRRSSSVPSPRNSPWRWGCAPNRSQIPSLPGSRQPSERRSWRRWKCRRNISASTACRRSSGPMPTASITGPIPGGYPPKQPIRTRPAPHRYRPQRQLRLAVGCRGPHPWDLDVCAAHPQKADMDVAAHLKRVIDQLAFDLHHDPFPLLFPTRPP